MLMDDMARNPMALVQALARPNLPGVVHPTVEGMTPDDPNFRRKVQPPEPMSRIEAAALEEERRRQEIAVAPSSPLGSTAGSQLPPGVASPSTYRLLVTSCRQEDTLIVGLECPPDWDVSETWTMSVDAAQQVARVMRAVGIRIKDMSGGFLGVPDGLHPGGSEQVGSGPDPRGPRDQQSDVPDVRGEGSDHAGPPVGGTDPDGAPGVRPLDPESSVEFLEAARRRYEEELARQESSASEPDGGEATDATRDDREDALRRRLGLSQSSPEPGSVWGKLRDPDGASIGHDPLAPGEAFPPPE